MTKEAPNAKNSDSQDTQKKRPFSEIVRVFVFAMVLGVAVGVAYFLNFESPRAILGGIVGSMAGAFVFTIFSVLLPGSFERFSIAVLAITGFVAGVTFGAFLDSDLLLMGVGGSVTLLVVSWIERGVKK